MQYSLMTEPQTGGTYDQILRAARLAESEGLHSFARSDHLAWSTASPADATDAFATVAGLARETETVRLCVLVTPITFRHPAIIAKNAATIDQMSGARLDLGVGTGWNEYEHEALGIPFPPSSERWSRLEDAIGYLLAAFGDGHGRHSGPHYDLDLDVRPKPGGIRLVVGGTGKLRTSTIAGSLADEYNIFVCPPEVARARISVMRDAAGSRKVEATMMGPVTVAASETELSEKTEKAASRRGISSEEMVSRWDDKGVLYGTPDQLRERIAALEDVGVERIYLQWFDLADYDGMARMLELVRG